jgi:DNA N-6-adenine-methyltransferase (Dam)
MTAQLFTVPVQGTDSDERFTPKWLFDALAVTFDLDVAAPIEGGDFVPTLRRYTRNDDGLAQPWHGFVWCNPPFSHSTAWAEQFIDHANGLWLGPVANSAWMTSMAQAADRLWLMRDFAFHHPTHAGKRSSMPLAMVAIGARAVTAIDHAARLLGPDVGVLLVRHQDSTQ